MEYESVIIILALIGAMVYLMWQGSKERENLRTELYAAVLRHDVVRVREDAKNPAPLQEVHYVDETREFELQQNGNGE